MPGEAKALLATFIWAITSIILADQTRRISALSLNAMRALCAAIFLAVYIPSTDAVSQMSEMSAATAFAMIGSGLVAFAVGDSLYFLALRALGASLAVPISESCYPLMTFGFAWLWLDERFSTGLLVGAAFVIAGIVLLTIERGRPASSSVSGGIGEESASRQFLRGGRLSLGLLVVMGASLFWALSTAWLRAGSGNLGPEAASVLRVIPVAPVMLLIAASSSRGLDIGRYRRRDFVGSAVVGVFGMGVASLLYVSAIQDVGASRTAILTATVPLFALPLAVVFLRERVTPRIVLGTVICTAGIWFII